MSQSNLEAKNWANEGIILLDELQEILGRHTSSTGSKAIELAVQDAEYERKMVSHNHWLLLNFVSNLPDSDMSVLHLKNADHINLSYSMPISDEAKYKALRSTTIWNTIQIIFQESRSPKKHDRTLLTAPFFIIGHRPLADNLAITRLLLATPPARKADKLRGSSAVYNKGRNLVPALYYCDTWTENWEQAFQTRLAHNLTQEITMDHVRNEEYGIDNALLVFDPKSLGVVKTTRDAKGKEDGLGKRSKNLHTFNTTGFRLWPFEWNTSNNLASFNVLFNLAKLATLFSFETEYKALLEQYRQSAPEMPEL